MTAGATAGATAGVSARRWQRGGSQAEKFAPVASGLNKTRVSWEKEHSFFFYFFGLDVPLAGRDEI